MAIPKNIPSFLKMSTTTSRIMRIVSGMGRFCFWRFFTARLFYFWWYFRARKIAKNLAPHLKGIHTIIDIGAGNGLIARELTRLHPDLTITLIDVMDWNVSSLPLVRFDGSTIPFADHTFDVALLIDVLHHSRDKEQLLREAFRVARKVMVVEEIRENQIERKLAILADNLQVLLYGMSPACEHFYGQDFTDLCERIAHRVESLGKVWHHPAFLLSRED